MRLMKCVCGPGGTVSVQGPEYGAVFGENSVVDFDAKVSPNVNKTWGETLERYAHLFVSLEPEPQTTTRRRWAVVREEGTFISEEGTE